MRYVYFIGGPWDQHKVPYDAHGQPREVLVREPIGIDPMAHRADPNATALQPVRDHVYILRPVDENTFIGTLDPYRNRTTIPRVPTTASNAAAGATRNRELEEQIRAEQLRLMTARPSSLADVMRAADWPRPPHLRNQG